MTSAKTVLKDVRAIGTAPPRPPAEIEVGLLTGGSDKPYAFGLAMAIVSKGVHLDIVGSDEVRKVIQNMDAFREDGIFKLDRYKKLLASSRMTTADFENNVRTDLLHDKILTHLSRFARISDSELKDRFAFDNDQLKLEYVAFTADGFRTSGPVSDEALNVFFEGRKQAYLTEPQVKLRYITFLNEQALAGIQVSDQEIEQYYKMNPDKFSTPEQRQARHILLGRTPRTTVG